MRRLSKMYFFHKIMKYDSPFNFFWQMVIWLSDNLKKDYIFCKLINFCVALWRILRFSRKMTIFAKIMKFGALFSKIYKYVKIDYSPVYWNATLSLSKKCCISMSCISIVLLHFNRQECKTHFFIYSLKLRRCSRYRSK